MVSLSGNGLRMRLASIPITLAWFTQRAEVPVERWNDMKLCNAIQSHHQVISDLTMTTKYDVFIVILCACGSYSTG